MNGTYSAVLVLKDQTAHAAGVTSELDLNFTVNVMPQVHAHAFTDPPVLPSTQQRTH
jgi:hypothetical protein